MLASLHRVLPCLAALCVCFAQVPPGDQVLWKDPGAVESLDLAHGPGGLDHAPAPPFKFIQEDFSGTHPKVKVRDARGRIWAVKFGNEIHSEPFASRIAWAAGYFIEPMYFIAGGTIQGARKLKRAASYIQPNGHFRDARFQLRDPEYKFMDHNNWSWSYNPFQGTRELNGLKIVIALTSNWDNKDARDEDGGPNTAIFEHKGQHPRYIYTVTDWGGSMGHWGNITRRSNWNCPDFASDTNDFIRNSSGGHIGWGYRGKHSDFLKDVTLTDIEWILRYLGRIQPSQFESALIATGATPSEADCFTGSLRRRIDRLRELVSSSRP